MIGDYSPELPGEVLKHPGVSGVDCVQPDAQLTAFVEEVLPVSPGQISDNRRVRVLNMDPRRFTGKAGIGYDVILLGGGEPVNAEMNRFYTVEFFSRVKSLMNPGGLFSFGVPAAPDIIGPRQAVLLKSLYATLREVFDNVVIVPGETVRFIASQAGAGVTSDPQVLIERMHARHLDLRYVRDFYLLDLFNPIRLAYMDSIVGEGPSAKLNRDFEPVCYLYGLGLWGAQLHPAVGRLLWFCFRRLCFPGAGGFWSVLFVVGFSVAGKRQPQPGGCREHRGLRGGADSRRGSVGACLSDTGRLRLQGDGPDNFAFYGWAGWRRRCSENHAGGSSPAPVQDPNGTCRLPGRALSAVFRFPRSCVDCLGHDSILLLFSALAFLAGVLGGGQFSTAVSAAEKIGGAGLYAADLIGASAGALAGSLFFLPVLGIPKTLLILGSGAWRQLARF